jgi:hypothetical protein
MNWEAYWESKREAKNYVSIYSWATVKMKTLFTMMRYIKGEADLLRQFCMP